MTEAALLRELGEGAVLERLCGGLPTRADVRVGAGDDCAVVAPAGNTLWDWLLKSDPTVEGVHFTAETPSEAIGHKALGRVLSDIAAMGGEPLWALVNVTAPPTLPLARLEGVYAGLTALARNTRVAVVGGDLSAGPTLALHVFGVGRVTRLKAVLRSGAQADDVLFVTGALGGSLAGKHLAFEPRLLEGRWLCENGWATAMIDVSDGLATDLRHIVARSQVGAELMLDALPIADAARNLNDGRTPAHHALTDGEDFELLFTVPPAKADALPAAWAQTFRTPCARIGRITAETGAIACVEGVTRRPLAESGFDPFRAQ